MKPILRLIALAVLPLSATADQNWDGDNPIGNFSSDNNWFGDSQPAWGFANGNLRFSLRNNAGQTSLFYDYAALGGWVDTNDIFWDAGFGAGLTWEGNGNGINFNQRLQNDSAFTQVVGATMNLSGAKNGATQIELNPVNGNLTLNGAIFNDNSVPYAVYGNNGKTLTINTTLGVGATPGNVFLNVEQNSTVVVNNAQTYAGGTNVRAGVLEISDTGALGAFSGGTGYLGIANTGTLRYTGTGSQSDGRLLWIDTGTQTKTIEVTSPTGSLNFTATGGQITQPLAKTGAGALILADVVASRNLTVSGGTLTTGAITMNQSGGQTITVAGGAGLTSPSFVAAWPVAITLNGTGTFTTGSVSLSTGASSSISGTGSATATGITISNFMALNFGASGTTLNNTGNFAFTGTSTLNVTAGTLANTGNISMAATSTLNLSGGTLSAAGSLSMAATSTANITGGTLNTGRLVTADNSGAVSTFNQSAGTVNITGSVNGTTSASFLLSHWPAASTYNLSGGVLNAPNAPLNLGWDGVPRLIQTGGTANLQGINFNNGKNNAATYQLTNGRLNIGSYGMNGNASAKWLELNGGTLGATANWTGGQQINAAAASTIDTLDAVDGLTGRTITINGVISGAGQLNKAGAGTLVLSGGNTHTGALVVNGGTLAIGTGAARTSASFTVNPGATLSLNGTNLFVAGHGVPLAASRVITVNNATLLMPASTDTRIGNVVLHNGSTWTSDRGLTNYDALLANTDAGPATVSVTGAGSSVMNGSGGLHLQGVQNFDVADVTGSTAADLTVSLQLDGPGTTGGAAGGLNKTGAGTMVLSGNNTYNGATTVSAGTLLINGTHTGGGLITVSASATLGGNGSIGVVDVAAGGILSPGNSAGNLTVSDLTLNPASVLEFELGAPTLAQSAGSDFITATSSLTLNGILNISPITGFGTPVSGDKWLIMTSAGGIAGSGLTIGSAPSLPGGLTFEVDASNGAEVFVSVVPEAGTAALSLLGVLLLRRRRSRQA